MKFSLTLVILIFIVAIIASSTTNFVIASSSSFFQQQSQKETLVSEEDKIRRTFYFESHGRDDAREWRAAFLKGLKTVKIDFNFRSNSSNCVEQKRLNPSGNMTPSSFPFGCLVLTHYYDSKNKVDNYFTPSDLIDFIAENADTIFAGDFGRHAPFYFQMCLKNGQSQNCCPLSEAEKANNNCWKWIQNFKAFYNEANKKLSSLLNSGRIQFVFDSLDPVHSQSCFFPPAAGNNGNDRSNYLFGNWNSTWTGDLSTATNNNNGNSAAQMPNMEWSNIKNWQKIGANKSSGGINWGKFKHSNSTYPVVFWEPSEEMAFDLWYSWFLVEAPMYHPAGINPAFNPDPVLYHTYAAASTKRFEHSVSGAVAQEGAVAATLFDVLESALHQNERVRTPLLLRCAHSKKIFLFSSEKTTKKVECMFHLRDTHSRYTPIESSKHDLPQELVKNFSLPLLDMQIQQQISFAASQFIVTFVDSAGIIHTSMMQIVDPRGTIPPKYIHPVLCDGNSIISKKIPTNLQIFGANSQIVSGKLIIFGVFLDTTTNSLYVAGTQQISSPSSANSFCPKWIPFFDSSSSSTMKIVENVCLNSTEKVCSPSSSFSSKRKSEITQVRKESFSNNKLKTSKEEIESGDNNWFAANIGAYVIDDTTSSLQEPTTTTTRIVVCYNVERSVYCSSSTFSSSTTTTTTLLSLIPAVNSTPVKVGVGRNPTVSFPPSGINKHMNHSSSVFITYGYSFCMNTQLIDDNSAQFYSRHICDLRDSPVVEETINPMQSYLYARNIEHFEQKLKEGNQHLNGFASTCDSEVLHGVWESTLDVGNPILIPVLKGGGGGGASNSSSFYDEDVSPVGDFVVVTPSTSLTLGCLSTCGSSNPGLGKVRLDAFPIPGMTFKYRP